MTALAWPIPELSAVDIAFPAHALDWMPKYEDIPDEFKERGTFGKESEFVTIAHYWFANGLNENVEFYPREGVNAQKAFDALRATLGSYAPKHEHKIAAVAYMMACWFEEVKKWKHAKRRKTVDTP